MELTKHYYTYKELAEMLGVHINTVQNWKKSGKMKVVQLGKSRSASVRIPRKEVEKILNFGLK